MPGKHVDTLNERWSIGEGVQRVVCPQGHAEAIGASQPPGICDAVVQDEPCGLERVSVAVGPFEYVPDEADAATRLRITDAVGSA